LCLLKENKMGKYGKSKWHDKFSDFHWKLGGKENSDKRFKGFYMTDIDRLWIPIDFSTNEPVAVIDIKDINEKVEDSNSSGFTHTEEQAYKWFISKNVRVFCVYIRNINKITNEISCIIKEYPNGKPIPINNGLEFGLWELSLREKKEYKKPEKSESVSYIRQQEREEFIRLQNNPVINEEPFPNAEEEKKNKEVYWVNFPNNN